MDFIFWVCWFAVISLFWKWILSWGGAEWLEGWKAIFILDWFTAAWSAEQIRLYALIGWILSGIWFVVGLFFPDLRASLFEK